MCKRPYHVQHLFRSLKCALTIKQVRQEALPVAQLYLKGRPISFLEAVARWVHRQILLKQVLRPLKC